MPIWDDELYITDSILIPRSPCWPSERIFLYKQKKVNLWLIRFPTKLNLLKMCYIICEKQNLLSPLFLACQFSLSSMVDTSKAFRSFVSVVCPLGNIAKWASLFTNTERILLFSIFMELYTEWYYVTGWTICSYQKYWNFGLESSV